MNEFQIGTASYRKSKLNAFEQFHCLRRIGPIIGALTKALNDEGAGGDNRLQVVVGPVLAALSTIADADLNFVITTCLKHVARQQPGGTWAPVMAGAGNLMFDDIDMQAMLQIVWNVLEEDLASFFGGLASSSIAPGASQAPN
jgi:hypothetical protein